jgi:cell division protein FtsB
MDFFSTNIDVFATGLIGLFTTIVSGWTSWIFARKKYNSEVDNQVITNMKESLDFYKQLSDDNKERLDQVLQQNKEILAQNAELIEQNKKLQIEVEDLKRQIKTLTDRAKKDGTSSKKNVQGT